MPKSSKKDTAQSIESDSSVNSENAALSGGTQNAGAGSVDQIRDLIFGTQMQNYEKRFNCLEEMLIERITSLKDETAATLNSLENTIKKELDTLSDRLTEEKNEREQSLTDLSQEVKNTSDSILKTIQQLSDSTDNHIEELRQQSKDQSESLGNELQETKKVLENAVQKLRHDSVDRTAFASMLGELANSIKNLSTVSDPENVTHEK